MNTNSLYVQNRQAIEQFTQQYVQENAGKKKRIQVTIPVVFHVVYQNATENIPDAQLFAQLSQLNLDFAKMNSDTNLVPAPWKSIHANTDIQFCLAVRDPQGNPTTGITRTQTTVNTFTDNDNVKFNATGGKDAWPASDYLNFWVCDLGSSLLGYAQFPGGPASTDGIVCNYDNVGSMLLPGTNSNYDLGRTATHEVGHWLNLYHIWGDDGSACSGSDQVGDTPNQGASNGGCPSYPLTDNCTSTAPGVMFMNYMDYVYDACMYMFTEGQKARMQAMFATGGARASLLNSQGCVPVPACVGTPVGGTATASLDTIKCQSNLTLTAVSSSLSSSGISVQWQHSTNGTTWTNITGANTNPATINISNTVLGANYFRVAITCAASNITSYSTSDFVYREGMTNVTGNNLCVAGNTTLTVTNANNNTVNWYSDAAGTNLLFSGNPYPTSFAGSTTIYAGLSNVSYYSVGAPNSGIGAGGNNTNFNNGLIFTTATNVTIDTIFVYPGSAGKVVISLYDDVTNALLDRDSITVTTAQVNTKVPVPCTFNCPANGQYFVRPTGSTVTSLYRNTAGFTYPYTIPGVISITGPIITSTIRYPFFYDWRVRAECQYATSPVAITIGGLNPVANITNVACNGGTGSITVNATGSGLVYSLNGGAFTSSNVFSNVAPGNYTITVSNGNNCTATTTAALNNPSIVTSNITITPATSGNNGVINATGSGGTAPYTYSLNNGVLTSNGNFTSLAAGVYTVCTQDANLCSTCSVVTVNSPNQVFITINSIFSPCIGTSNGIISLQATSGSGPYTYSINGSAFNPNSTFNNLAAGVYTIVAQDALSQSVSTTVVLNNSNLNATVTAINTTTGNCNGQVTLSVTGGSTPYSFTFNGTSSGANTANLCAGTYTYCVADAIGCTACATAVVIEVPPLTFLTPTLVQPCLNTTNGIIQAPATGGQAPLQYSIGGVFSTSSTFTNLPPGVYTVTVKDDLNSTASTIINLQQSISISLNINVNNNALCNGTCNAVISATAANAVAPYTYSLNGGAAQTVGAYTNLCAGSYTIVGTDASGCTSSQVITVTEPTAIVTNTQVSPVRCIGESNGIINLNSTGGTAPYMYAINNNAFTSVGSFGSLATGTYTVHIQDANGCTSTTVLFVPQAATQLTMAATATMASGGNNGTINALANGGVPPYTYTLNNGSAQAIGTFTGLAAGAYTVTAKDAYGCMVSYVVTVSLPEGIGNINIEGTINVCPNPATQYIDVTIDGTTSNIVQIQIINALGQVVQRDFAISSSGKISKRITTDHISSGNYSLLVLDEQHRKALVRFTIK